MNIYDTKQHGVRGGLASVLVDCHIENKNKEVDPEYRGKENCFNYLDFNSLFFSAIVQALPTGEIKECDDPETGFADSNYTSSSIFTGHIYTIDVKYNDELKQKNKEVSILSRQRLTVISLQTLKMKIYKIQTK